MLWPANQFVEYVAEEVEGLRRSSGITGVHDGFLVWTLIHHYDLPEKEALKAATYSGTGDLQIDALWVDERRNRLTVIQTKTSDPLTKIVPFGDEAAKDLRAALSHLRSPSTVKDPILRRAMLEYTDSVSKARSIELVALVSGIASPALDREIEALNHDFDADRKSYKGHHASIVQLKDLNMKFYQELTSKRVGTVEVPLRLSNGDWNYHKAFGEQAYVVDLDARVVGQWIKDHEYAIIASNLRYPLVSKYNDGILGTLDDSAERNHFWFYNNGMTIVCDEIKHSPSDTHPALHLVNPQIVNGCQTAFTIRRFMEDNSSKPDALDGVLVPTRIIQTRAKNGLELNGEKIARFTNSQNAITSRDLRANDEVQKVLQLKFERRGYFFERKNGEWRAVRGVNGPRAKAGFRYGRLANDYMAQLALAFWLDKPAEAKTQYRLLFEEGKEGFYTSVFKPESPELLTAEDFLVPYLTYDCFTYWWGDWEGDHPIRKRGTTPNAILLRHEVLKHGNFYFVSVVGRVLRERYGIRYQAGGTSPDHKQLAALTDSLELSRQRIRDDGHKSALLRALSGTWTDTLSGLAKYCSARMAIDPETDARKTLIRRTATSDKEYLSLFNGDWIRAQAKRYPNV